LNELGDLQPKKVIIKGEEEEGAKCFICKTCVFLKKEDTMLLCDGCPRGAHLRCMALEDVPATDWFCGVCTALASKVALLGKPKTTTAGTAKKTSSQPTTCSALTPAFSLSVWQHLIRMLRYKIKACLRQSTTAVAVQPWHTVAFHLPLEAFEFGFGELPFIQVRGVRSLRLEGSEINQMIDPVLGAEWDTLEEEDGATAYICTVVGTEKYHLHMTYKPAEFVCFQRPEGHRGLLTSRKKETFFDGVLTLRFKIYDRTHQRDMTL
jgi:hypothetical protein